MAVATRLSLQSEAAIYPLHIKKDAGVSLVELMVAVAIIGVMAQSMSMMMGNQFKTVAKLEQRVDINAVESAIISQLSCSATIGPVGSETCTAAKQGQAVTLLDRFNNELTSASGSGPFAGSKLMAGNIYVKATCDYNRQTIEVRFAMKSKAGNEFARDPLTGQVMNFTSDTNGGTNPLFGYKSDGSLAGSKLCQTEIAHSGSSSQGCASGEVAYDFNTDGSLKCRPVVSGSCASNQYVANIAGDGAVTCASRGSNVDCGAGKVARGINADGTPICDFRGPNGSATSSCASNTIQNGIKADGTPNCMAIPSGNCATNQFQIGINANGTPKCAAIPTGSCGAGTFQNGVNADGTPKCVAAFASSACATAGQVSRGLDSNGAAICDWPVPASQACAAGEYVSGVAQNGTVTCVAAAKKFTVNCAAGEILASVNTTNGTAGCSPVDTVIKDKNGSFIGGGYYRWVAYSPSGSINAILCVTGNQENSGSCSCKTGFNDRVLFSFGSGVDGSGKCPFYNASGWVQPAGSTCAAETRVCFK